MFTLLCFKRRAYYIAEGNLLSVNVAAWMGGESGRGEWIRVHVWLSPFAVH